MSAEVVVIPNVHIRGVSDGAVARIDAESAALGLSRNEFLRRKLEGEAAPRPRRAVTPEDWRRSAEMFSDLADPDVMDDAWR
ncbi:type II toxin-antitoxin system VapB family antitoxin [Brachybacterium huguangmaarense]